MRENAEWVQRLCEIYLKSFQIRGLLDLYTLFLLYSVWVAIFLLISCFGELPGSNK